MNLLLGLAVTALVIFLLLNRLYMAPDRLAEVNSTPLMLTCGMTKEDKIIIDWFWVDADYYIEIPDGKWRLAARRTIPGQLLCFPLIGCLTSPNYMPECFDFER